MGSPYNPAGDELTRQTEIHGRCLHPTGTFIEFKREDVEQSVPERFEQQVRRHPDRLAVKTTAHRLSYAELNAAANRVARAVLAQRGNEAEPVALLFEKGAPMMAAILGVLKAGKIYVPLDPSYPYDRISFMLEDSEAGLVVTNNQNPSMAGSLAQKGRQVMNIDQLAPGLDAVDSHLRLSPDDLACILYTSGSTGQPKGVVQSHRSLLHVIMRQTNNLHVCPEARLSFLGSCTFIGGLRDTLSALLNGAAVFPFDVKEEGLASLCRWLIQEEITIYNSAMPLFRQLAESLEGDNQLPKLRMIKWGGETLYKRDVELYRKRFSQDCKVYISMGSTEVGTATCYFLDKETQIAGEMVPAGYPNDGMEVLLLDEAGQAVGFNQSGEIAVKSRYLSLGYWRRPDLTRGSFLPDPNGGDARIYLTGDLGLRQSDGCLRHMGRKDFQVKVRGNRVETTEVETALMELENVKQAVVAVREGAPGNQRLVAYIVPREQPASSHTALRRSLSRKLPSYMVPSVFVNLDELPVTPTGKLDRRALPAPDRARPELGTRFLAPRTPVEAGLTEIWAQVLGLDQVGLDDNFLELGGDSLLATQVVSRVINAFKVDLPLRVLFSAPTVARMAVVVAQHLDKRASPVDVELLLTELEAMSDDQAKRLLSSGNGT